MLGKYEILEELGRGSFATVFRARDTVLGRDVALKILHPQLVADPVFVERFENDARAAAQLDHPHIVTVYDLGQLEGGLFISMQLLPGGTLAQRIGEEGPLRFEQAVRAVGEIAGALEHAHGQGFVHRDVKPSNILFNARGEVVLADFGLVRAAEGSLLVRSSVGGVVGTPAYIPPEVWEGQPAGPATDLYALGCVFFELLTGEVLFKGDTSPAVMRAHFQAREYPQEWPQGVPGEVAGVLEQALAQDPAARYPSARAFARDLQALAERAADPLAEPYQALQAALRQAQENPLAVEGWERALQLAQEIAAQDPDCRDVGTLRQEAAEGQARAERAQWAAQWREQALAAEEQGELEAARTAARRWLEMAPGNEDARELEIRMRSMLSRQAPRPDVPEQRQTSSQTKSLLETGMVSAERVLEPGLDWLRALTRESRQPSLLPVLLALAVVGIVGVLLASFGTLLFNSGYVRLGEKQWAVEATDNARLEVLPEQLVEPFRVRFLAIESDAFLAQIAGKEFAPLAEALPSHLVLRSPLYRIQLAGTPPAAVRLTVPLPAESQNVQNLDLYSWGDGSWAWLSSDTQSSSN